MLKIKEELFAESSRKNSENAGKSKRKARIGKSSAGTMHIKGTAVFLIFVFTVSAVIYSFQAVEKNIMPALISAAEMKVKAVVKNSVLESVKKAAGSFGENTVLKTVYDESGKISMVALDTVLLNRIGSEISEKADKSIEENSHIRVNVNAGSIAGSSIAAQILPDIGFDIVPVAVSNAEYFTEFESTGINQTKYRVYIEIDTEAKILIPPAGRRICTENTILIAEAVIMGNVPYAYSDNCRIGR